MSFAEWVSSPKRSAIPAIPATPSLQNTQSVATVAGIAGGHSGTGEVRVLNWLPKDDGIHDQSVATIATIAGGTSRQDPHSAPLSPELDRLVRIVGEAYECPADEIQMMLKLAALHPDDAMTSFRAMAKELNLREAQKSPGPLKAGVGEIPNTKEKG